MSESTELRDAVKELKASIDGLRHELVRKDVYASDKLLIANQFASLGKEVADLEKKVDKDIDDRKADRRLIVAAFLALVAQIVLQVYQQAQGAA